jgi:hypothetical protein
MYYFVGCYSVEGTLCDCSRRNPMCRWHSSERAWGRVRRKKATHIKIFFIHTDFNLPIHRAFWHLYKTVKSMPYNKSNCEMRHNKQIRQSVLCYRSGSVLDKYTRLCTPSSSGIVRVIVYVIDFVVPYQLSDIRFLQIPVLSMFNAIV